MSMFNANVVISAQMERSFLNSHMEFGILLINECAAMFGFSADEAIRALNLSSMQLEKAASKPKKVSVAKGEKAKKPKAPKASFPIPFSGKIIPGCCTGLRFNRGLFTQCPSKADTGFCNACQAQAEKNSNGKPDCGTIADRMCMGLYEFRDPKGKAPIAFTTLLKKLKLSEDAVKEEAGKLNIEIDPEHFDFIEIAKKGRKASTEKKEEPADKKGKGRPKKSKKILEVEGETNDLFASLVAQANNVSELSGYDSEPEEMIIEKPASKVKESDEKRKAKEEEKAKKELAKLEEKEAKRLAIEAEKEAKRLAIEAEKAKKEAEKEAKRLAVEAEKARKEAEKKAKEEEKKAKEEEKAKKEAEKKAKEEEKKSKVVAVAASPKKEKSQANDEPDVVKRFEFEGKKYLKSKNTGIVYNMDQDVIGKWNEATQKIDFYDNNSDEEVEDDYDDEE